MRYSYSNTDNKIELSPLGAKLKRNTALVYSISAIVEFLFIPRRSFSATSAGLPTKGADVFSFVYSTLLMVASLPINGSTLVCCSSTIAFLNIFNHIPARHSNRNQGLKIFLDKVYLICYYTD
jgi:hypothetical protein